jgi:F0F1-type ATP synthase assembly protein I
MDPGKGPGRELGEAYQWVALGFTFGAAVVVFTGIGWLLDKWLRTIPIFTVVATLVGAVLGFLSVYFRIRRSTEESSRKRETPGR